MNRFVQQSCVFVALVAVGVAARVGLQDVPNFAPVAALALFAGCFFPRRAVALAAPLLVMLVSDLWIDAGGYPWPLMWTVYGLLALPVLFRGPVRRHLACDLGKAGPLRAGRAFGGLLGCSLACSLIFFLGTNGMVWLTGSWYAHNWAGLLECFGRALPFFRYTLAGDAVFATIFFGAYALSGMLSRSVSEVLETRLALHD